MLKLYWLLYIVILALFRYSKCTELTFELPDSARECFHEEIKKNTTATLEFQVEIIKIICKHQ